MQQCRFSRSFACLTETSFENLFGNLFDWGFALGEAVAKVGRYVWLQCVERRSGSWQGLGRFVDSGNQTRTYIVVKKRERVVRGEE